MDLLEKLVLTDTDLMAALCFRFALNVPYEVDLSVFGLTQGRLEREDYFVFYNQQASPNREIRLLPDLENKKQVVVNFSQLPAWIDTLAFTLSSNQSLQNLEGVEIYLCDPDKTERYSVALPLSEPGQGTVLCQARRLEDTWELSAPGQPVSGDLGELLAHFTQEVAVQSDAVPEPDVSPTFPIAPSASLLEEAPVEMPTQSASAPVALPLGRLSPQDTEIAAKIIELARRVPLILPQLHTEEATKHALVLPLLQALGYDVFNPLEVTPELTADVGVKKGEKVNYAILREGQPIILIECKHHDAVPSPENASQLYRYFSVTEVRYAVLTNGLTYRFYTDLEKPNTMDRRPFLEVNLLELKEGELTELLKFAKHRFDQDNILSLASEMKYIKAIKLQLTQEFDEPSDEFIRLLSGRVFDGRLTSTVRNRFTLYTKRALSEFVAQIISDRLRDAFEQSEKTSDPLENDEGGEDEGLSPSPEEWQGFYMVRSMVRDQVDYSRLHLRKHQSYSAVLLDNNRRRTVCRFYFSEKRLLIGLMDKERQETKVPLKGLDDLFKHATEFSHTVRALDRK